MSQAVNVYCDESCHLEHDQINVMVLGALSCPEDQVRPLALELRDVRRRHGLSDKFETKWNKVSPALAPYYLDLIALFLAQDCLSFRTLVIPDKSKLRHDSFGQTHDEWYYKMYYCLLRPIPQKGKHYKIYLDIKDTRGGQKVRELNSFLSHAIKDSTGTVIANVQQAHSRELVLMQLTDLLIGAIAYANRGLTTSTAKSALVSALQKGSGITLKCTTAPGRKKVDVLIWEPNTEGSLR